MSMPFRRNVVVPIWFAIFALVAFFLPPANSGLSIFLLVLGIAVPTITLALWRDPPLQLARTVARRTGSSHTT
jgi:hypothetical protein